MDSAISLVLVHCRLTLLRMATAAVFLIPLAGNAAELSDESRALGKERRDAVIAQAKQQVVDLEKQRADAAKGRDMARVSVLLNQIKQAKLELAKASKKTVEDYANELVDVGGNAANGPAITDKPRLRKVSAEMMAQLAEVGPLGISNCLMDNNCRLIVEELGSLRATQNGAPPSFPVLRVVVVCTSDEAVESFEVACHAYDSFDAQILTRQGEQTFTERYTASAGRTLTKGQTAELRFYFTGKPFNNAYKCQAWVSQVRLASGKVLQQTHDEAAANDISLVTSERVSQ
jgi:hypothetical protein